MAAIDTETGHPRRWGRLFQPSVTRLEAIQPEDGSLCIGSFHFPDERRKALRLSLTVDGGPQHCLYELIFIAEFARHLVR